MSDLDKELNFDDIAGKKIQVKSKTVITGKTTQLTGTVLPIPTDDASTWINKDLADCTGQDFVNWAKNVYPIDISKDLNALNSLSMRVHTFKNILYYHTVSLFQSGKNQKLNTTIN